MSNVLVEKQKIDILANAISNKSGEPLTLTLDEMVEAVDGIETETEANLQEKQYSVNKAGQELIQADSGYDGLSSVIVNTPRGSATGPTSDYVSTNYSPFKRNNGFAISTTGVPTTPNISAGYISGGTPSNRKVTISTVIPYDPTPTVSGNTVTIPSGFYPSQRTATVPSGALYPVINAGYISPQMILDDDVGEVTASYYDDVATENIVQTSGWVNEGASANILIGVQETLQLPTQAGATIAPTESAQTAVAKGKFTTGAVTVSAIPSNYVGSGITQRSSTDLTVSGATVTVPSGYYSAQASKSVASGTAGTPTATKGTVSNHSVSITPSVTNTTGYITGGTKSGTAVTVSASELVSGSETKTENGTYDVTNLAELVVNVQGGGSSGVQGAIATPQSGANNYLLFGNLVGNPTSFSLICAYDITIDDTPIVSALTFDGTNYVGQLATILSNANAHAMSTGFSHSYDSQYGQIMISSENAEFDTYNHYILVYTYGGSASDIHTADVQVGSGATSITFPVTGKPTQWSCVFKSDFGTSSGYQRTIAVANDGTNEIGTYGLCLDSSVHASNQYWTVSYSGGNLTISSQGTNAGGYFHQPGYYQLTYIIDESAPSYQTKTVTPTTSQQIVTADTGYDALSQVTVNAMPTGIATSATTISGTAATVSTGTNTLTLTKTVSNTPRITTAGYISTGTAGNSSVTLTANVTTKAAATITPGTTNQTIAAGTYLTGAQTIAGDADLVGSNILSTANIFNVQGTVVVQNYYTGSSAPSSSTGSNGDLYLQS